MQKIRLLLPLFIIFSLSGNAQWSSDPMANTAISDAAGEQAIPKVATSESGITYVSWFSNETGNYNVLLQKFDVFGNKLWAEEGLVVSDHEAMSYLTEWDMTVDQEDCAILTFQDVRNGGNNDVFAYRISPDGDFLWGEDGIEMSDSPAFDVSPKVTITNTGNAVFAWEADSVIIIQKISPEGLKLWGELGITLSSDNSLSWPQLLSVGDDDMILKYFDDSGPYWAPNRLVFAQRFNSDGNPVWTNPAIISDATGIAAWNQIFPFINDGNDGFYIAWHDDRDNDMLASVFVQHIDVDGQILFADDGIEASTMAGRYHSTPNLALPPGSDHVYVYWNEMDGGQNDRGIYGQKFSEFGERQWTDNGKVFIEISSTIVYPFASRTSQNDMVVFYEQYYDVISSAVFAMRIDADGNYLWEDEMVEMCAVQSQKIHSDANTFNNDQWISVWDDNRNGNTDIYGQNIKLDGTLGVLPNEPEIEIIPDTLFINENAMDHYIYINNVSFADYVIDTIIENAIWWDIDNMPEFPYNLEAGQTLEIYIPVYIVGYNQFQEEYIFDTLFVASTDETKTSIVAFNLEVIPGISNGTQINEVHAYPNPSTGEVYFNIKDPDGKTEIFIYNNLGKEIKRINLKNSGTLIWNGMDNKNQPVKAGTYFYRVYSENYQGSGKIILL